MVKLASNKLDNNNIVNLFFSAAKKHPNTLAIIEKDKSITFAEFSQSVKQTATYFQHKGIQKGDRVMIFVPMSIDLYRIVLALFHLGATAVFLDEWVSKKRMEQCCEIAQCKAFIGGFKLRLLSIFSKELRKIPIKLGLSYNKDLRTQTPHNQIDTSDTALITFTTGSTGIPKAAKRTHGFLRAQFSALVDKINPQPNDVDMPVLPIVLLINLGVGCTSVIADFNARKPESLKEQNIIKQIQKHQVNRLVASPFLIKRLAAYMIDNEKALPSVRKIFTGGAPVFPQEASLYKRAFPQTKIEIVYGSTEAEPISAINVNELIAKPLDKGLNVGAPYHKTTVKIIKISDKPITCDTESQLNQLECAAGTIGEIVVSGAHVLRAYFNNEKALLNNKIFIDENCWHRTGDSGYLDKTGTLFLTGKCNTLIETDNGVMAPFIFENYFQTLEGVAIGTILEIKNQVIAFIELSQPSTIDTTLLLKEIRKKDSRVDNIKILKKIPRDPRHNSKIDYDLLRQL